MHANEIHSFLNDELNLWTSQHHMEDAEHNEANVSTKQANGADEADKKPTRKYKKK